MYSLLSYEVLFYIWFEVNYIITATFLKIVITSTPHTLQLGAVHTLCNHFSSVSRPPPPFRNQIRHWIEQKLHKRNHSETPLGDYVIYE